TRCMASSLLIMLVVIPPPTSPDRDAMPPPARRCLSARRSPTDAYRHQVLARSDAHRVAVKTARIRALHDLATRYQAAVHGLIGRAQPPVLTAEMGVEGRIAGPVFDSLGGEQRDIDFDTVADQSSADRNPLTFPPHPQRHD